MAKFCAECGAELTPKGKFCGSCGAAVPVEIKNCPTCGQEWDGTPVNEKSPAAKKTQEKAPAPAPARATVVKEEPVRTRIAHNTTAAIQPIYGPLYVEGKDCPNCGTANMANKTCKTCESEN